MRRCSVPGTNFVSLATAARPLTSVYLIVQKYPEKVKRRRSNYHRMLRRSAQKSRSGLKPKTSAFLSLLSSFSLQLKYRAIKEIPRQGMH